MKDSDNSSCLGCGCLLVIALLFFWSWPIALGAIVLLLIIAGASGNKKETRNTPPPRPRSFEPEPEQAEWQPSEFEILFFSLLAKMAKADGVVSPSEAEVIKGVIKEWTDRDADRYKIRDIFNRARDDNRSFEEYCTEFCSRITDDEYRQLTLSLLCSIAGADGRPSPAEMRCLYFAERRFGLDGYTDSFFGAAGREPETDDLPLSYRILGVSPDVSDAELKKAYHDKCRRYHPDTLRAKGLPPRAIREAEKEMQKINAAYDAVCRSRRNSRS